VKSAAQQKVKSAGDVIDYSFGLNLEVTGGTWRFKHATGSLSLAYNTHTQLGGFGASRAGSGPRLRGLRPALRERHPHRHDRALNFSRKGRALGPYAALPQR